MRIQSLEAGRGVAAFIVLLYHIPMASGVSIPNSALIQFVFFPANFGEQSVYFFMMLSGYVLANAYMANTNFKKNKTWVVWRCLRLFPIYYSALLLGFFFSTKNIRISDLTHFYIFKNNTIYSGINPPLWSLTVEIMISILALPLIKNLNRIQSKNLWALSSILYLLSYLIPIWGIRGLIRSLSMFVVGLIIFKTKGFGNNINYYFKIIMIVCPFILSIFIPKILNLVLIVPLALIIDLLLNNNYIFVRHPITKFFGKYSFSLYATHWIVLTYINKLELQSFYQVFFTSLFFSMILAFCFAKFFEFPLRKMARKIANSAPNTFN